MNKGEMNVDCPNCSGVNVDWFLLKCPECGASESNGWDPDPLPPVHRIADSLGAVARQLWEAKEKRAAAPFRFLTAKEGLEVGNAVAEGLRAGLEIAPMRAAAPILADESTFTIFGTVNGPITVKQSDFIRELNKEIYKNLGINSSLLGNSNK